MKNDIKLRPIHYASVSGGKDSLYMLNLILNNPNEYPLDMVVHFQLEIDWDWTNKVVDFMEDRCRKGGIKFVRIKPRKSWQEIKDKYGLHSRVYRWCNSKYKMDCKNQLHDWIKSQNCRPLAYIGLCADETKRFKYTIGDDWHIQDVCYPLAEEGITEDLILEWARGVDIFNGWYKTFRRQGCMFCPMLSRLELAYMLKYYPNKYNEFIGYIRDEEKRFYQDKPYWYFDKNKNVDEIDKQIRTKWLDRLETAENTHQVTIWDLMKEVE